MHLLINSIDRGRPGAKQKINHFSGKKAKELNFKIIKQKCNKPSHRVGKVTSVV